MRIWGKAFRRKDGTWWARVIFEDPSRPAGKNKRELQRRAKDRTEAREIVARLKHEIEVTAARAVDHERKVVSDLIAYYRDHYATEPEYHNGRRVTGLRSWKIVRCYLGAIEEHLGHHRLRSLSYDNLRTFKARLLRTETKDGKPRSHANAHRILATLRRMLNIAKREGWIITNPFDSGEPLISTADEVQRERILSPEEEAKLLQACSGPQRAHLYALVVAALDTGCRFGELIKLRWADVDFSEGLLTVRAENSKVMRARSLALTKRLTALLLERRSRVGHRPQDRVFGVTTSVKTSFRRATARAGLEGVRFHDLRHTAATRLIAGKLQLAEVGRVLGHSEPRTTYRYVNISLTTLRSAADILDAASGS